jgi:hypothetical protein
MHGSGLACFALVHRLIVTLRIERRCTAESRSYDPMIDALRSDLTGDRTTGNPPETVWNCSFPGCLAIGEMLRIESLGRGRRPRGPSKDVARQFVLADVYGGRNIQ